MIRTIRWSGDHEGHVVLDGATDSERVIDRPGDMVTAIMDGSFASERHGCVAAAFGVCLAMRGVKRPEYLSQVVDKAITFLASADPQSLQMYKVMNDLRQRARSASGLALRRLVHEEARAIHERFW